MRIRPFDLFHVLGLALLSLIAIPNHLLFRTYAYDLGLYNHALYQYRQGKLAMTYMVDAHPVLNLSDHFDLYLIILSPLSYVFGNWTLILVQIAAIGIGTVGFQKLILQLYSSRKLAGFCVLTCYLFVGTLSAVSFDYHSDVLAVFMLPWLLLFLEKGKVFKSVVMALLICIGKENMGLLLAFLLLAYSFYIQNRSAKKYVFLLSGFSLIYSLIVILVVMPAMSMEDGYRHYDFALGNSFSDALVFALQHPFDFLRMIFGEHLAEGQTFHLKVEFALVLLISGMLAIFWRPWFLIAIVPLLLQKFLHRNPFIVGLGAHYTIGFLPVLVLVVYHGLYRIKSSKRNWFVALHVMALIGMAIYIMDNPRASINKENIRIYQSFHYARNYDTQVIRQAIQQIPADASISTQSPYTAQLAMRDSIYQFPIAADANYILLNLKENSYPISGDSLKQAIQEFKSDQQWDLVYEQNEVHLFRRN